LSSGLLLGESGSSFVGLFNTDGLLVALEFNMAVGSEVGGDSTMGSVSASTSGDGSLADGVVNDASLDVEGTLLLVLGVGLKVDKEILNSLDGLLGPSSKLVLENFTLGVTADTTGVHSEGDDLSVLEASIHVFNGLVESETLAGAGNIVSVLVMDSEVTDLGHSRFGGLCGHSGVLDHWKLRPIY